MKAPPMMFRVVRAVVGMVIVVGACVIAVGVIAVQGVGYAAQAVQTPALPARPALPPIDWIGTYAAEGSSPTGTYTATMAILRHGETYEVQWTFPNGDGMIGVGFVYNGDLVVGYTGAGPGVIVYHVVERTPLTLEGRWTGWGVDTVSPERAVKGPPAARAQR